LNLIKDPLSAFNVIRKEIIDELGFYYSLTQIEVVRERNYNELSILVENLINLQRKKGVRGFFKRLFLSLKMLNETFINITEFESQEIFIQHNIEKDYREVLSSKNEPYFRKYIEN
jgi:hypothetical protein